MSPRAIIIPSAASMISSKLSIPCWFRSSQTIERDRYQFLHKLHELHLRLLQVRTNEIAMKLIPCSKPEADIVVIAFSKCWERNLSVRDVHTFCLAMIPSFSTSTTNSRFAASFLQREDPIYHHQPILGVQLQRHQRCQAHQQRSMR